MAMCTLTAPFLMELCLNWLALDGPLSSLEMTMKSSLLRTVCHHPGPKESKEQKRGLCTKVLVSPLMRNPTIGLTACQSKLLLTKDRALPGTQKTHLPEYTPCCIVPWTTLQPGAVWDGCRGISWSPSSVLRGGAMGDL